MESIPTLNEIVPRLDFNTREYTAGRIDGDGRITGFFNNPLDPKRSVSVQKYIVISTSTNLESLERVKNNIKGYKTVINPRKGYGNDRNSWDLKIVGSVEDKIHFLREIKPHLINKQHQCDLVINLFTGVDVPRTLRELEIINQRGSNFGFNESHLSFLDNYKKKNEIYKVHKDQISHKNKVCIRPAYLAGCMDTDGSITIQKAGGLKVIVMSSVKESYIEKLRDLFYSPESIHINSRKMRIINRNPLLDIYIYNKYKLEFLNQLIPFMDTRKPQAQVGIDYLQGNISNHTAFELLAKLNKRGRLAWGEEITIVENVREYTRNSNRLNRMPETVKLVKTKVLESQPQCI